MTHTYGYNDTQGDLREAKGQFKPNIPVNATK
jgi:hypothetical protein